MCLMSSLCVIVVNDYVFRMTIMRYMVAKPISMALTLKPKYGYCPMCTLVYLPVPCISTSRLLILPELYLYMGSEPSKSPRLATVKAVHSPVAVYMDPSLCWQGSSTPSSERGQLLQNREGCSATWWIPRMH